MGRNGCVICYKKRRKKYKHALFSQIAIQLKFFWLINTFPTWCIVSHEKKKTYIKSQRRDNIGIPPLLNEKGELCEDAEDKAEILSRQYTSVFTQDNPLEPVPDVPYSLPSMPDINIEENGILKLLKEVNVYKAIGPDLSQTAS